MTALEQIKARAKEQNARALVRTAREAAFALESAAHLRGLERELLPYAERLRAAIANVEPI
jgi:hypothetical protein